MLQRAVLSTPWQPLTVIACDGIVRASWFGDRPLVEVRESGGVRVVSHIDGISDAVDAWIAGQLDAITRVPVAQSGGEFFVRVWDAMRDIPAGDAWSYSELAAHAGRPRASRAAGTACAINAVAPFVPCHRVVRSDGRVGAYGYGVDLKVALLRHEGAL